MKTLILRSDYGCRLTLHLASVLGPTLEVASDRRAAISNVRKVSLWLGHASLQSTEVYLRADPTEKLEALAAMMPLG